jgi:WD40 repeat protein
MWQRLTVGRIAGVVQALVVAATASACSAPAATPAVSAVATRRSGATPTAIIIVVTPRPLEGGAVTLIPQTPNGGFSVGEARNVIHLRNARRIAELNTIAVSSMPLTVAEFAPDEPQIATFGYDKTLRLIDLHSGGVVNESLGHNDYGFALAWSPDGLHLASVGGSELRLWDVANGAIIGADIEAQHGQRVSWSRDGQQIAVAGPPSTSVQFFGADGSQLKDVPMWHEVWAVAYASNGMLAVSDNAPAVTVYDPGNMQQIIQFATAGIARDIAFSPDGALIAACMEGGRFDIWRTNDWVQMMWNTAHAPGCIDGTFSASGELYFSVGQDMRLIAWNPVTGAQVATVSLGEQPWWVSLSPDNTLIAVAGDSGSIHILGIP